MAINGLEMEVPLCSNYSDVDDQQIICRVSNDESEEEAEVILAINMGDLAARLGIAEKTETEEEPGFVWNYVVETPVTVTLSMKEKGGYANEYLLHQLIRTNDRGDYEDLTDEEYANFRNVKTTGMGEWALFRSSSPVDPEINRSREADEALNNAGIRTVLNLADSEEKMKSYEDYSLSYYSQRDVIALNMTVDYTSEQFGAGLAKGIAYMVSHEGPYLVHCSEGKDRTGFVCAVFECLMGASAKEAAADYMVTYYNYYAVEPGTEPYAKIRKGNIEKILGLDQDTIAALKEKLGRSYAE